MTQEKFDKGDRARIGYLPDGRPLLAIAWDIAQIVKSYSLAFTLEGRINVRVTFNDNSFADFSVDVEKQPKLYESLIKHMGFTVAVVTRVGDMAEEGKRRDVRCIGKPFPVDFSPKQLESLKTSFATFKLNH